MNHFYLPLLALGLASLSFGQATGGTMSNPLSAGEKGYFAMVKNNILKSAEEMPEENYSFKPTDGVRTFGQLIAHVADAQYGFCARVLGDTTEHPGIEKTVTGKAELITHLKSAFAYCDQAYDGMTDAHAADMIKFFNHNMGKLTVLSINTAHAEEHYGNMVTYLRIKGLVPPSSKQ